MAQRLSARLGEVFHVVRCPEELNIQSLEKWRPKKIFIPHWSWRIPEAIFRDFECVIFHMTDLPYGRGGSPLQNLILRGHAQTKICALRCVEEWDAGPVYLRKSLSLEGNAEEILTRASQIMEEMIADMVIQNPPAQEQIGEVTHFKRRKPEQSRLPEGLDLNSTYDFIRMLDGEGYPKAFFELGGLRYELSGAEWKDGRLQAQVNILKP